MWGAEDGEVRAGLAKFGEKLPVGHSATAAEVSRDFLYQVFC